MGLAVCSLLAPTHVSKLSSKMLSGISPSSFLTAVHPLESYVFARLVLGAFASFISAYSVLTKLTAHPQTVKTPSFTTALPHQLHHGKAKRRYRLKCKYIVEHIVEISI